MMYTQRKLHGILTLTAVLGYCAGQLIRFHVAFIDASSSGTNLNPVTLAVTKKED